LTKTEFARIAGISRTHLYYRHKLPERDWRIKQLIESVLRDKPSYGHKRLADHLDLNKKRILRVMNIFGIKPYRRRGRKWRKSDKNPVSFPNLLLTEFPTFPNHIWASDFTHISFHGKTIYLATVIDLYTRIIAGFSALTTHSVQLVMQAFFSAIHKHALPVILHSDHASKYSSKAYLAVIRNLGTKVSMSKKGAPWENGYQESFYSQFKVDLGDPSRFRSFGELVAEIYRTIWEYNNTRIHSALKMPPTAFIKSLKLSA